MRVHPSLLAIVAMALAGPGFASSGKGNLPPDDSSVVSETHALPLGVETDAVRFSTTPALGGRAIIIELHVEGARAVGSASFFAGHPRTGKWEPLGFLRLAIPLTEFTRIIHEIGALMAKGDPGPAAANENGDIIVCADGGYLTTELSHGGVTHWLTGQGCSKPHPNDAIADLLGSIVKDELQRFPVGLGRTPTEATIG